MGLKALPQTVQRMEEERGMRVLYRHKKRGTVYELIGFGKMQAVNWEVRHREHHPESGEPPKLTWSPVDMQEVAIYRNVDDYTEIWVRPREEFEDGRFEVLFSEDEE